jgi:hypothetical protein
LQQPDAIVFSLPLPCDKWYTTDRTRRLYVKALKERLDRTESLLKAAGLLDEENLAPPEASSDDDVSLDDDGIETESEDDLSSMLPRNSTAHRVRLSKSGAPRDNSQQSELTPPDKLSGTGDSQHVSLIRGDNKADTLYYGMSLFKCPSLGSFKILTPFRTFFLLVHFIQRRD